MEALFASAPPHDLLNLSSQVVVANIIDEFFIKGNHNEIELILNTTFNKKFSKIIKKNGDFWDQNKIYFQDDFLKFIEILKKTLIRGIGEFKYKLSEIDASNKLVKLYNEGVLNFDIFIKLEKKKSEIEILDEKIEILSNKLTNIILDIELIKNHCNLGKLSKQIASNKRLQLVKTNNLSFDLDSYSGIAKGNGVDINNSFVLDNATGLKLKCKGISDDFILFNHRKRLNQYIELASIRNEDPNCNCNLSGIIINRNYKMPHGHIITGWKKFQIIIDNTQDIELMEFINYINIDYSNIECGKYQLIYN